MLRRSARWVFAADSNGRAQHPRAIAGAVGALHATFPLGAVAATGDILPPIVALLVAVTLLPMVLAVVLVPHVLKLLAAAVGVGQRLVSLPLHDHPLIVSLIAFFLVAFTGGSVAALVGQFVDPAEGFVSLAVSMVALAISFAWLVVAATVLVIAKARPATIFARASLQWSRRANA